MARKSKAVETKLEEIKNKLQEAEALVTTARQEEQDTLDRAKTDIEAICAEADLFCGVILSQHDIVAIVELAFKTKESVKIPFNLYFND